MKSYRFLLPLMLLTLGLGACGPANPSNSGSNIPDQSSEIIPGVTQYDIDFNGIEIDNEYTSGDYRYGGILQDLLIHSWIVVGDVNEFDITASEGPAPELKVEIEDGSILKYEAQTKNNKSVHTLTALKTGGTTLKIYVKDGEDFTLILRIAVNARVAITDHKLIFDKLATADYWGGVFTNSSKIGDFRLFFDKGAEGLYNACTLSLKENAADHGIRKFDVDYEAGKIVHNLSFHLMSYPVTMTQAAQEFNPVAFEVSLSLDTLYIADKEGLIDFFRPVYLS